MGSPSPASPDLLAHALLDAPPQFDGHQRIHAEVEESGVLADLRRIDSGHLGHRVAQVVGMSLLRCCTGATVSRSTSSVLPEAVVTGTERHLALQLGQECPLTRQLVER